jgi:hypothetical protein
LSPARRLKRKEVLFTVSMLCSDHLQLEGMDVHVLESCHSTWVFDPAGRRFRRVPRGIPLANGGAWTPYHALDVDESGAFSVSLNAAGTRWLRSRVHSEPCQMCGSSENRTTDLPAV